MAQNVQFVKFLRNTNLAASRKAAITSMEEQKANLLDGSLILGRYTSTSGDVKTIVGAVYNSGDTKTITYFDVDGAEADVEALRQEINDKLGTGVTSANTATAQFANLSGTTADTSATTSVAGAKAYAKDYTDEQIGNLEYNGVTTGDGVYVTNVTQSDGVVSATTATLPSVTGEVESKKVIMSVSEDKGTVSFEKGTIESSDNTVVINDVKDAQQNITGIDFKVHVDNRTLIVNTGTGVISVADAALVQYEGDDDTIQIGAVSEGVRTVSSLLTISATTPTEANVKEQYNLVGASGNTIGATIKIYKDSALLSVALLHADTTSNPQVLPTYNKATNAWTDIPETAQTQANQALCYAYEDVSGNTVVAAVPVGSFINEQEFASGLTWDATENKVKGVVDPNSENFLTVGADGFKLSGVQSAITSAVQALDVTDDTAVAGEYVAAIEETDGIVAVKTRANVSEAPLNNYSKGSDAAAVAATDTVNEAISKLENQIDKAKAAATTEVEADTANTHVTVSAATNPTTSAVTYTIHEDDIASASALTAEIEARKAVDGQTGDTYSANTASTYISGATSLNDADVKLNNALNTVATNYVSGVTVNGNAVTVANNVAPISVVGATTALTASNNEAIVVNTNNNGEITLGLGVIDCGEY